MKSAVYRLGFNLWQNQNAILLKEQKSEILNTYFMQLTNNDWDGLERSSYYTYFKELKPRQVITSMDAQFASPYLQLIVPVCRTRVVAQLRLCGRFIKFHVNNISYFWDGDECCTICNMQRKEDISHFLLECPQYGHLRQQYLKDLIPPEGGLSQLLKDLSTSQLDKIFFFVSGAIKIRSFIMQE